ncbi:Histidinol phosphatase [Maridesulfovibrio ferrireducens]|uniref:Histidinol phosphatase n=1 Tax=Maridesulfovibrio ferrireducens TaxID=246191 RepID=A0A1G9HFA1_9BACT|nr:histidinol phosphate phosphatase domain-containing protein [Maridesulfovibrio ferrireducens]SDL11660.1 Histidinol phosphatase [Maridesulfovibrio ferrireducens]
MIDFHTHTVFSDGELIPAELARRARIAGYRALAMTDHADSSNIEIILENIHRFAKKHGHFFDIDVFSGVELTHVPPGLIGEMVDQARDLGAQLVVVHGETIVEPVAEGTNLSAIEAKVDILAHPGLITEVEVKLAAEYGVHLEITTRKGHSLTNGHVAALARKFGAKLVINNDAHAPGDLVSRELRRKIALGAGMTPQEYEQSEENSRQLVQQMMKRGS